MDLTLVCRYAIQRGTETDRDVCGATATYSDLTLTGAANAARSEGAAAGKGGSAGEDCCPQHYGRESYPPLPAAEFATEEDRRRILALRYPERIPS